MPVLRSVQNYGILPRLQHVIWVQRSMRKNILIFGHNDATQFIDIYNQYTKLFDPSRYKVTVAYLTGEPNEAVRERTLAEEVLFFNFSKSSIRTLKLKPIAKLLNLTRKNHYDMVICHRYKPSYIMMWVAQFIKIPTLIFVMHELGTMSARGRQWLVTLLWRRNMWFAGVSNAVRDDLQNDLRCVAKDKIVTLYNTIDVELTEKALYTRDEARGALKVSNDIILFGTLARLVPNKDLATLIEAFASIKPNYPNAKLIILGDGILETQLKSEVSKLHLEQEIIFTGFIANGFRYMKAFDCFTLSSIQEAFGRVLIEAMIAKLPILATRVNGIPEVMGDTGWVVPAKAPPSFAKAMLDVLSLTPKQREVMGENAYQRAVKHFSIPAFKQQFWQVFGK
ncbi:MAG: hypothetical protein A3F14_01815 [Gammaproteobacteria bacterium RIFCSPHIGHO2_12_FULL_43_28]|nr:MAG: hypothetical protein A3F14_01815 [Gammaproteobacteria bacterium RIFCSPHIGHO2_12_FULL_43_28]